MIDLAKIGMRTSYAVYILTTYNFVSQKTLSETFDALIKTILLCSTEVPGVPKKKQHV